MSKVEYKSHTDVTVPPSPLTHAPSPSTHHNDVQHGSLGLQLLIDQSITKIIERLIETLLPQPAFHCQSMHHH